MNSKANTTSFIDIRELVRNKLYSHFSNRVRVRHTYLRFSESNRVREQDRTFSESNQTREEERLKREQERLSKSKSDSDWCERLTRVRVQQS